MPHDEPDLSDLIKSPSSTPSHLAFLDEPSSSADNTDLDPDIAALLDDAPLSSDTVATNNDLPDDLSEGSFPEIREFQQEPNPVFLEKDYYAKVLSGVGEISHRLHSRLQEFLKENNPQEQGLVRQRLIDGWWSFGRQIVASYHEANIEKRLALRFGYLLPTLVSKEQCIMLASVISKQQFNEPIHYLDEWFELILREKVNPLATDEVMTSKKTVNTRLKSLPEKTQGSKEATQTLLLNFISQRTTLENNLAMQQKMIQMHHMHPLFDTFEDCYSSAQNNAIQESITLMRELTKVDKKISDNFAQLGKIDDEFRKLSGKIKSDENHHVVDEEVLEGEFDTVRQVIKLCVGRQGNHFPFLVKRFFTANIKAIATRENVIQCMSEIEKIDIEVFRRTFKQKVIRIVPHTIIVPCFGNQGICWEPFERMNRATSRGRIAIPLFPKELRSAVITALGDLRWNVTKERAAQHWMTEGLSGAYYQWFSSSDYRRSDLKQRFLEDYLLWVTKEVEGIQKLEREVRGIFWRHIPFPQKIKDVLRHRGYVYNELYKKDMTRYLSDGY